MAVVYRWPQGPIPAGAGTAVNTTTLTSGFGGIVLPQLQSGSYQIGARVIVEAMLEITVGSTATNGTFDVRMGSVGQAIASKTILAQSSALALPVSTTAVPSYLFYAFRIRALSPTAMSIYGQGYIKQASTLTAFGTDVPIPITAAARTVSTLNSAQVNELDIGITLSQVTGSPTVTLTDCAVELSG